MADSKQRQSSDVRKVPDNSRLQPQSFVIQYFYLWCIYVEVEMANNNAGIKLENTTFNILIFADDIILLSASADGLRKHFKTLEIFVVRN